MGDAVFELFIKPSLNYDVPNEFGLYSASANQQFNAALRRYALRAQELATKMGLVDFHTRLSDFQNGNVSTSLKKNSFDDFFGWSNPACFDRHGNMINTGLD